MLFEREQLLRAFKVKQIAFSSKSAAIAGEACVTADDSVARYYYGQCIVATGIGRCPDSSLRSRHGICRRTGR